MARFLTLSLLPLVILSLTSSRLDAELPRIDGVAGQPLVAQVKRIVQALEFLGQPLSDPTKAALDAAFAETDEAKQVADLQKALDPLCLAGVHINPESRVKVTAGDAKKELTEQGWTVFLVKVPIEL